MRELQEEVGVNATVDGEPHLHIRENVNQPDGLVISLWVISSWSGLPTNGAPDENDNIRWVSTNDLNRLSFAHWSCREVILESASQRRSG